MARRPVLFGAVALPRRLPHVRVLADRLRRHDIADSLVAVLLAPASTPRPVIDGVEVLFPTEIGLSTAALERLAFTHGPEELRRALRPALLSHLLRRGAPAVVLDPEIVPTRPLTELAGLLAEHPVLLTPRLTAPLPADGLEPSAAAVRAEGAYSPAFVAANGTEAGRRFADWWFGSELRAEPLPLDRVPALFDHLVVRDPSWHVDHANLATRSVERASDGVLLVSGRPCAFLHLPGYDPARPHLVDTRLTRWPRVLMSETPGLRELCDEYAAQLRAAGAEAEPAPVPDDPVLPLPDGIAPDRFAGPLVRAELARRDLGHASDLGLGLGLDEGLRLGAWLDQADDSEHPTLTRYLRAVYLARSGVQAAYPEVRQGRAEGFFEWVATFGQLEEGIDPARVTAARSAARAGQHHLSRPPENPRRTRAVPGVEAAGLFTGDLGIGQAARQTVAGLELAGVPVSTTTYTRISSRVGHRWQDRIPSAGERYDTALICFNPDLLPTFLHDAGRAYLRGRYRIGLWYWELEELPEYALACLRLVDEIWVSTRFVADALGRHTTKPVRILPLPVHAPARSAAEIPGLPVDDTFTFLFVFDHFSIGERKNPAGLVRAFREAFPDPGVARLVIKSINGAARRDERERIRYAVGDRTDIVLLEDYLDRAEVDALMWRADAYVSLHRSEGFGQTVAEAMAIGKPVVVTDYSGNTDFTRPDNAFLVPYTLVPVPEGCRPYPPGALWAEPDHDAAVAALRLVASDAEERERRGRRAAEWMRTRHTPEALGEVARARLEEIRSSARYARRTGRVEAVLT